MNLMKRLNREYFYLLSHCFEILWFISRIKVDKKILAQYLQNYARFAKNTTGTWYVNTTIAIIPVVKNISPETVWFSLMLILMLRGEYNC